MFPTLNMKERLNFQVDGEDTAAAGSPAIEPSPRSTYGFGPREHVDDTRQAQHGQMNDVPLDVNFNAVAAREQALTWNISGKNYEANADIRNKIATAYMGTALGKAAG